MKRITLRLPDNLATALNREARRRGVSVSEIAREAIEAMLRRTGPAVHKLPFVGLGRSGYHSTAANIDEILKSEWTRERLL